MIDFSLIATLAIDPNKLSTSTYPINSGSANAATPNTGAIEADTAFKHVKRKPTDCGCLFKTGIVSSFKTGRGFLIIRTT
ncbi:MAG: hypothetical protein P1U90_04675 [Akkermansiaceae bacterium]|nr:hypothetical protein [Akkermansiaceae bacterium]